MNDTFLEEYMAYWPGSITVILLPRCLIIDFLSPIQECHVAKSH
jgi:hypothetical protein